MIGDPMMPVYRPDFTVLGGPVQMFS